MPLRFLEYDTRLILAYRQMVIHSIVLYLGGAGAQDTGQHVRYDLPGQVRLSWRYDVLHLWQLDGEEFLKLERPALLALIGQTRIRQPEQTIPQAVGRIIHETSGEQREQLLAELLLLCSDEEIATMAEQIITRDYGLPETPIMRKLREEGRREGYQEGREEGQLELVLRQLVRRCGSLTDERIARVQQLDTPRLLQLAEALLDFTSADDLDHWLTPPAAPVNSA